MAAANIARVIAFVWTTFLLGLCILGGLALLLMPDAFAAFPAGAHLAMRPLGGLMLLVVAGYWGMAAWHRGELAYRRWTIAIPSLPMAILQTLVSCLDWTLAGAVLYALLPAPLLPFGHFVGIFMLAQVAGLVSHVPGGLGVFETVMVLLLSPALRGPDVLAALVMYRLIYYLIPFTIALMLLIGVEFRQHRTLVLGVAEKVRTGGLSLVPMVAASITFAAGLILLISGATPGIHSRLHALSLVVPLPVLELSHFLASLIGVGLLILARGLLHRVNAAYYLALLLLGSGAVFSVLKGLDWEEATALLVMFSILLPTRRHFFRRAAILGPLEFGMGPGRYAGRLRNHLAGHLCAQACRLFERIVVAIRGRRRCAAIPADGRGDRGPAGAGRHVAADAAGPTADASAHGPRNSIRPAGLPARRRTLSPTWRSWATSRSCSATPMSPSSCTASPAGCWLPWAIRWARPMSRSRWPGASARSAIAWRPTPRFTWSRPAHCPSTWTWGLDLLKLGEEARVPLGRFCIEDLPKTVRRSCHRLEKELTFELRQPGEVPSLLPELRAISDAWLTHKNTREKRFSLGRFDERYLSHFPVALLKQAGANARIRQRLGERRQGGTLRGPDAPRR